MADEGAVPEVEMEDYESGPFCRHWGEGGDCDEICCDKKCGHRCSQHALDGACQEPGCECGEICVD